MQKVSSIIGLGISLVLLFFFVSPAQAKLWNQVVATYNKNVVTLWDVRREIQIERIQNGFVELKDIKKDDYRTMVRKMIVESLVYGEAETFRVGLATGAEIEKAYSDFQKKFKGEAAFRGFIRKYQWGEKELKRRLTRGLVVQRFIKEKILSVFVYMTEQEIAAYQKKHPGLGLEQAKKRLKKERIESNLKDWVSSLKARNRIQMIW